VSGLPVTLALRSEGLAKHVALDSSGARVTDIRRQLGVAEGTHLFTGIYCVNPDFLKLIRVGEKISVIPSFLELAKSGQLGAVVLDEGVWLDLGDRESYLQAHRQSGLGPAIHPLATVDAGARVERSVIGPGAIVENGAVVRDSVVWPGGRVLANAVLDRCVVFAVAAAGGIFQDSDIYNSSSCQPNLKQIIPTNSKNHDTSRSDNNQRQATVSRWIHCYSRCRSRIWHSRRPI
jgi:NDP-sugar pyrophosphorylase family protein